MFACGLRRQPFHFATIEQQSRRRQRRTTPSSPPGLQLRPEPDTTVVRPSGLQHDPSVFVPECEGQTSWVRQTSFRMSGS